jgi:hypothetical protein
MPNDKPLRQSFELPGGRIAVFRFTAPDQISIDITPQPRFGDRETALAFLAAYIAARSEFLEAVATLTGLRVAVVDELPGGLEAIGHAVAPAAKQ